MENSTFPTFLAALRRGYPQAADELIRRFDPYIRRVVGLRLTDPRLRRILDSMDLCQSILARFLARAASGKFELATAEDLRKLLVTMVLNRIRSQARKERKNAGSLPEAWDGAASDPEPGRRLADDELLQQIRSRLSERERWLVEQRAAGRTWPDIAAEVGESPEALRMQQARAIARVRQVIRQEESSHAP
jgi:RNA polymerase sigma factor (sigma-70 family)